MGRVRRGGYIITWWIGDHEPHHVQIRNTAAASMRVPLNSHAPLTFPAIRSMAEHLLQSSMTR